MAKDGDSCLDYARKYQLGLVDRLPLGDDEDELRPLNPTTLSFVGLKFVLPDFLPSVCCFTPLDGFLELELEEKEGLETVVSLLGLVGAEEVVALLLLVGAEGLPTLTPPLLCDDVLMAVTTLPRLEVFADELLLILLFTFEAFTKFEF